MSPALPRLDAFAVAAPGLEPWLARELNALGISGQTVPGGVTFASDIGGVYRVNLHSRLASRVIVRIAEFRARALGELARRTAAIPWEEWLAPGAELRVRVSSRKSRLYHTGAVAERVAEGVRARVNVSAVNAGAERDADAEGEDALAAMLLVVRLARDVCTISLDSSGALLHRRGYRQAIGKAPLRETLAAAMLITSEWDPRAGLADPLCGSGTIAIEAALLAREIAPGLHRAFAFEQWPRHDERLWLTLRDEAQSRCRSAVPAPIHASDRDDGAVAAASENARRAGVADDVILTSAALSAAPLGPPSAWVITNPPYGVRVGETTSLRDLYASLGKRIRREGRRLVLLSADTGLERQLGLGMETVLATRNGGIDVRVRRSVEKPERAS